MWKKSNLLNKCIANFYKNFLSGLDVLINYPISFSSHPLKNKKYLDYLEINLRVIIGKNILPAKPIIEYLGIIC